MIKGGVYKNSITEVNTFVFEIKMSHFIKDELIQLGIYEKWLENTKNHINYCKVNNYDIPPICKKIEYFISTKNTPELLTNSFNWCYSKEGIEYWNDLYVSLLR